MHIYFLKNLQNILFLMIFLIFNCVILVMSFENSKHGPTKFENCSEKVNFITSSITKQDSLNQIFSKDNQHKRYEKHLFKVGYTENLLFKLIYHNTLQSIIDLIIFWKRKDSIFLIDDWSEISISRMKKYLSLSLFSYGVKIKFDVLKVDAEFDFIKALDDENRPFLNFVLICHEYAMQRIIETAKLNGIFNTNHTWIIVNHRIPEIFHSTVISEESLVTVMVHDSPNSKPVLNLISSQNNATLFPKPENIILKTSSDFLLKTDDLYWQELSIVKNIDIYDVFYVFNRMKTEFIKFANWNPQQGLHVFEFFEGDDNIHKLRGRTVRAAGFVHLPYVRIGRKDDGNLAYSGYMIDIIDMLMQYFNATATYKAFEPLWGILLNGTYTGLLNRLYKKEAEISMNGFSIVPDRVPVLNYLAPLTKIDMSMAYKTPESSVPPTTYLYPFSLEVWIFIFAILIVVAIALALVMLWSPGWANSDIPSLNVHSKKFRLITWTFLDEVLEDPPGISARTIFGAVLIGVLMCFIFYTSVFTSFLAYQDVKLPIRTMWDLVDSNDYGCVVVRNTIYEDMPRRAQAGLYKQLWDNKIKRTEGFSLGKSIYDCTQKMLAGTIVFTGDGASIIETMNNNCSVTVIRTALIREDLYLVTRSDFPYSRIFYIRMLRIKEGGIMRRLGKVYRTDSRPPCDTGLENSSSSFGIEQVVGLFFLLFCGIIISFSALIAEYYVDLKEKRTQLL